MRADLRIFDPAGSAAAAITTRDRGDARGGGEQASEFQAALLLRTGPESASIYRRVPRRGAVLGTVDPRAPDR